MESTHLALHFGHASHVGRVREINEDSYLILAPPKVTVPVDALMLVADGVGGAEAGEVASGILVQSFWQWFEQNNYLQLVHYSPDHADYFIAALKELLESCNEHLLRVSNSDRKLANMGSTCTVAVVSKGRLFLGHVGDTRAYMLRNKHIQLLTADHTWVADEVAAGRLTPAQAQNHPKRNLINRVMGTSPMLRVDRNAFDLLPGDTLIFTSDGLTGLVSDLEIERAFTSDDLPGLQAACDTLVAAANHRGGADNITVLAASLQNGTGISGISGGIAVSSAYLGKVAKKGPAVNPVHLEQPAESGQGNSVNTLVEWSSPVEKPHKTRRRWKLGILVLLVMLISVALALATAYLLINKTTINLSRQFTLAAWQLTALITGFAVWIGFTLGVLAERNR